MTVCRCRCCSSSTESGRRNVAACTRDYYILLETIIKRGVRANCDTRGTDTQRSNNDRWFSHLNSAFFFFFSALGVTMHSLVLGRSIDRSYNNIYYIYIRILCVILNNRRSLLNLTFLCKPPNGRTLVLKVWSKFDCSNNIVLLFGRLNQ